MALPEPRVGLVIGYDVLFREDADAGRENARKPHPAVVLLVTTEGVRKRVSVLAISHSEPPKGTSHHLKLTPQECRHMGLDARAQWVNLRDINSFDWPGFDLQPSAPGGGYVYGRMHRATYERVIDGLRAFTGRRILRRD